jgi:hypothetical protein
MGMEEMLPVATNLVALSSLFDLLDVRSSARDTVVVRPIRCWQLHSPRNITRLACWLTCGRVLLEVYRMLVVSRTTKVSDHTHRLAGYLGEAFWGMVFVVLQWRSSNSGGCCVGLVLAPNRGLCCSAESRLVILTVIRDCHLAFVSYRVVLVFSHSRLRHSALWSFSGNLCSHRYLLALDSAQSPR